ncbi:MAG: peptidylprolyl isomerase [Nitrosomonadales bacterium]|nr:peptidylprolyl isomerase [Nitrosomonadales bacterium]|tara:strand:- start:948 stop:1517 length:570 start_codon:yes stop_codon:yes gene_type:complete
MKNIIKIIIFNIFFLLSFNVSSESSNIYVIETNRGNISIEVYPEKAPTTVRNFQNYVEKEFYNGLIFHRIIPNFMIQGGGFDKNMMQKKTNDPIKNESNNGLKNKPYTLAMARTNDPHSATSQFFINLIDNSYLNYTGKSANKIGYCVFGEVIEGKDVVDKIGNLKTQMKNGFSDVPIKNVIIKSIKRR